MTSDCNAVRWSRGLVTQGTALKQGQAAKLSRTTFTRFSPIQHIYALYGHSHIIAVFFFTMTKGFNTGMEKSDGGGDIYSIYSPSHPPMSKEFSIFPTINTNLKPFGKR